MSDIKTSVLTVDTGGAKNNIKEFKQYIESLKGALLGLEKGTDEYKKVATELQASQNKLNEVMDVAKGRGEAVKGSYDNLVATMRELKKEWRATGDEIERKKLGEQILDINNQLKELDASTGNFQRNVGDYANAFEKAFDKVLGGLQNNDTFIGKLAGNIKNLIPVIKAANTTATKGLSGVKKAIASTGIGLLVVAVGTLAANWDKVSEALAKVIPWQKKSREETEKTVKANNDLLKVNSGITQQMDYQARIMEAQGKSTIQIINYKKQETEALLANTEAQIAETNAKIASLKAHSAFGRWIRGERKELKELEESLKSLTAEQETLTNSIKKFSEDLVVETIKAGKKLADNRIELSDVIFSSKNGDYEKIRSDIDSFLTNIAAKYKSTSLEAVKSVIDATYDLNKQKLIDAENDEINQVKKTGNKRLDELKKYLKEGKITEAEYKSEVDKVRQQMADEGIKIHKKYTKTRKDLDEKYLKETQEAEIENTKKTIAREIELLKTSTQNNATKIKLDFDLDKVLSAGDNINLFSTKDIEDSFIKLKEYNDAIFANTKAGLEEQIALQQQLLNTDGLTEDERLSAEQSISEARIQMQNLETENKIANLELENEKEEEIEARRKQRLQVVQQGLNAVGSLLENVIKIQQQQIEDEVSNGKISEQQAKKKFETVKKMQVASTIINTASAAMGAYNSLSSIPYVGPVLGAIAAAAAVAAGAVEIATIQKTQFGSSSSAPTAPTTPDVNSITNDFTPQYTQNVTAESEISELANAVNNKPIYVSVTDIEDTENTVAVREEETTY